MASKVYVVKDSKGNRSLVRANTAVGALSFKRQQIMMEASLATQDELLELAGVVAVEDATAAKPAQADIEDET